MNRLIRLFGTSIGRKLVMAGTGLMLIGFVLVHMLGNMAMFQGADALNGYAAWLQGHPLIWAARAGLLGVFLVHSVTAVSLALENRRARPVAYGRKELVAATLASRYIVLSGVLVLGFVIFHLGHFTFGWFQPEHFQARDAQGRHDVFHMVVAGFQSPLFSGVYVVSMLLVGFHLHHGVKSLVQTLGINHDSYNALLSLAGKGLVGLIVIGNCSFPVLVLMGVIGASGDN
ncbi:MAG: succinate dehydrogenase cytochrome b subunit [Proteobacteria bacterium]|nr:succinate dehydrogenase cytochrome b subunit [Pseudomonadota bacterium]